MSNSCKSGVPRNLEPKRLLMSLAIKEVHSDGELTASS